MEDGSVELSPDGVKIEDGGPESEDREGAGNAATKDGGRLTGMVIEAAAVSDALHHLHDL